MSGKIDKDTGIPVDQGKMCGETTSHAHLGNTGSCLCGLKKYPVKKEADVNNLPPCPWCGQPPTIADIQTQEVFCSTAPKYDRPAMDEGAKLIEEGCPAFSNVVSKERWVNRRNHESEVMWVPSEEPIFVLRGQDKLAQYPIFQWIDLGEKYKVVEHKLNSAVERAGEFAKFEQEGTTKLPD